MTFNEAINIHFANVDRTTGETISHREKFTRAINLLGGLDMVIPYIPFTLERIQRALKEDENLNNLSIHMWNLAAGFKWETTHGDNHYVPINVGIWHLYRKADITSASCSDGVCLLKEAARQWAERNH